MIGFGRQLLNRFGQVPFRSASWHVAPTYLRLLSTTVDQSASSAKPAEVKFKAINPEELSAADSVNTKLRRAILYVPGNDQRKVDKVKSIAHTVDTIVFDCEDGVAVNKKEEARHTILQTLEQLHTEPNASLLERLSVRINSMESGLAEEDLKVILSGSVLPQTILLPKVDSKTDIDQFLENFQNALKNRKVPSTEEKQSKKSKQDPTKDIDPIDLIIYVESARGLLGLKDICEHSMDMSEFTKCRLAGIVFGSDDFCANIGATRSDDCREVLLARQQVVLTAKAFDLQAIDAVYINFKDLDGLKRQSEGGASMGFTGKQAIHPTQIPVIQEAFRPSDAKIEWAKGLVAGFEAAQKEGKGAFVYRGQMIDMPLLRQAYNVLKIAQKIGKA